MKKILFAFLLLIIGLLIWFGFTKKKVEPNLLNAQTETNQPSNYSKNEVVTPVVPAAVPESFAQTNILVENFNAITATNLEQWKAAIKGLKYSDTFYGTTETWDLEQTNRRTGLTITLNNEKQAVQYIANFINISSQKANGDVIEIQMRSPMMNIDETRELGLQLCNLLNTDSTEFLAWCDKVGNHWMDMPLYGTSGNKHLGFEILNSFNDEKPWCINFIIQ